MSESGTPSIFSNPSTQKMIIDYLFEKKGFMFFVGFFISTIILFFAIIDPQFLTSRTLLYVVLIIIPFAVAFSLYSKVSVKSSTFMVFGSIIALLIVVGGSMYLMQNLGISGVLLNYLFYIMFFVILTIALVIIYIIFSNAIKRQTGAAGFWIRLIFFIPCLISDFFEYIRGEFQITPPVILWLLVLELVLLIVQSYIPTILKMLTYNPQYSLMVYPVYLSDQRVIATSDKFLMSKLNNPDKYTYGSIPPEQTTVVSTEQSISFLNETYRNVNYAFSFWTYINPGNISKSPYVDGTTNVLTYGTYSGEGLAEQAKPQITYANNTMIVYFAGSKYAPYSVVIPNQAWVHVVVNYGPDRADLYINGSLVHTHSYSEGVPPMGQYTDQVVVGQSGGLDGAIRDVRYYDSYLTAGKIAEIYNVGFAQNTGDEHKQMSLVQPSVPTKRK